MNKYILTLGFALIILSIIAYGYHETLTTIHRTQDAHNKYYYSNTDKTVYPYQNQAYIIAFVGIVTFLISLAIPDKKREI